MKDILDFLKTTYAASLDLFFAKAEIIKHKSANDVLSETDLKLNAFFSESILKAYPAAKIIAEESKNEGLTEALTFVVDPLDGTCNYTRGLSLCGIQIAVFENKRCVLSFIGLPHYNQIYYAIDGKGAYLNGERIFVDKTISHGEGILALSDFYTVDDDIAFDKQFELVKKLQPHFLKTRLFGAACIDFSYLATNKAQAYVCYYRYIWDIAPGLLISKEAGAVFKTISGGDYEYEGHSLVVANSVENLALILTAAAEILK